MTKSKSSSNSTEFKSFLQTLPIGVFRCTAGPKARFVYANAVFCDIFEIHARDISRISVETIFGERRKFQVFNKMILSEGSIKNFEIRLKPKHKKPLWCSLSAVAVRDEKGKVKWFDVVVDDISARMAVEKELRESKDLFQTVFNNTAAAITVTDKEERIVAWNPFSEQMLGMTKEDLFNKPVKELYPAEEWRRIRSFRIRRKGLRSDIETRICKKDGTILDANLSISVLKDLDGNIMGAIGIIRDITNQKAAERKFKESENKIRVILDNSAAAITLTDDQERIISWNKFTEHLLGMKKKDLYLKPVSSIYPPEEWIKIRAENIRKMGSKHHLETKVVKKNGDVIDIDLSVNVLRDEADRLIGSVGIMQDITRQKRFQEMLLQAKLSAEEANSAKSLFLANMSHEVRTPMNTIMGMIDLTLDAPLPEEQKENLTVAREAAENLLGLINDILDLSKVEAGKLRLETIEFHLPNVVKSVVKGLSVIAGKKSLQLIVNIHPDVPELVDGDPVRLRQVLINLINNAIKFTHKGKIVSEIKVASSSESGNEVTLLFSVIDEGIGIPKDKQERIFEMFSQADESTTRRFGGTGLGLAISKRIVEMMGGRIWVESEEGKGSKFNFTANYRYKKSERGVSLEPEAKEVTDEFLKQELKDLHILLAEDNVVNQKITMRMLEKNGWKVEVVTNGLDVVNRIAKENFDIVLMDAQMPGMDGFEATRVIRENEKNTGKHIPIVALTARVMQEDQKRCYDVGMDGYVAKPIDRKKLYETIANLFVKEKTHG